MNFDKVKGIYLITKKNHSKNEPFLYIGQARDIFNRFNQHCLGQGNSFIDREIKNKGIIFFTFEILEIISGQKERNEKEQKYISEYSLKYGENKLFNNQSGGKSGSKSINKERKITEKSFRDNIKEVFISENDFSIYLVAEYFKIGWLEVVKIRKPILEKAGLKWEKENQIWINPSTGKRAKVPWNGGVFTKLQIKLYEKYRTNSEFNIADLADILKVSKIDLKYFKKDYDGKENKYKCADEICSISLLKKNKIIK
jgi:hypothetical protein